MHMQTMITPKELADFLGVPIKTVYEWNSTGAGPRYSRFGRHVRYAESDVTAWMSSRLIDRTAARVERRGAA